MINRRFLAADEPLWVPLVLGLVPWLLTVLLCAGPGSACCLVGYAAVALAVGYAVTGAALPAGARTGAALLAPAVGVMVISAATAYGLRLDVPLLCIAALWLVLAAAGGVLLWRDRAPLSRVATPWAGALVVFSAVVCVLYFVPGARRDAVLRPDGSFNWMYVDTQYFHAIAADAVAGSGKPAMPGMAGAEMFYHFGPYVPAAVLSRLTGLSVGDALARVTRAASLWSFVLACFATGTLLGRKANGGKFGGLATVTGLFFYGSLLALFAQLQSLYTAPFARPVSILGITPVPLVTVPSDGGPFNHLILGHSELHGLEAVVAIMGMGLVLRDAGAVALPRTLTVLALPALAVAMNSVGALYSLGVAAILLLWGRLAAWRSWVGAAVLFALFLCAWKLMGYGHSPSGNTTGDLIRTDLSDKWWPVSVFLIVGLGFRLTGLGWFSRGWKDPLAMLSLATMVGLLAFFVLLRLPADGERYGADFLQGALGLLAFSRVESDWWRKPARSRWAGSWMTVTVRTLAVLVVVGLLQAIANHLLHGESGMSQFRPELLACVLTGGALAATQFVMGRSPNASRIGSAIVVAVLLVGFLAWIPPWVNYGLGRLPLDITVTPGEVSGLERLRALSGPDDRFATNKHAVDGMVFHPARSYAYDALSQRPVLLEGYQLGGQDSIPGFPTLLRENNLMFTTTDPDTLLRLARKYQVQWLVARPGTDLALPHPRPPWLVEEKRTGTLKIYHLQ